MPSYPCLEQCQEASQAGKAVAGKAVEGKSKNEDYGEEGRERFSSSGKGVNSGKCSPSGRKRSPDIVVPMRSAEAQGPYTVKNEQFRNNLVVITVLCTTRI